MSKPVTSSARPVGEGEYVVQQGDCMGNIAYAAGFCWETLWNHPANAALKEGREDPKVLLPGDRVHIPELRPGYEERPTDKRHQFVRKGVPEQLRIVLLDEDGNPRAGLRYTLKVDEVLKFGTTTSAGIAEAPIPPDARRGELIIHLDPGEERHPLSLGGLDPPEALSGIRSRLKNLGLLGGDSDDPDQTMAAALRAFQKHNHLEPTGELDDHTRQAIVDKHGF